MVADATVDSRNIFLITSSAGTAVVSELLATRPELWAGVVLDGPGFGPDVSRLNPSKLPPILMVMGGMDPGFDAMKEFVGWARSNRVDIRSIVYTNGEHGTYNLTERKNTLQQSAEFFRDHLK